MRSHYLQILFLFSSISFLAGCNTIREASDDFSTQINGPTQGHEAASMQQAPHPTIEQNQKETNINANAAASATVTGTTANKATNINSKTNIIPVTSQPANVKPAPTPNAPTVNSDQSDTDEPEVRSTPNTE